MHVKFKSKYYTCISQESWWLMLHWPNYLPTFTILHEGCEKQETNLPNKHLHLLQKIVIVFRRLFESFTHGAAENAFSYHCIPPFL